MRPSDMNLNFRSGTVEYNNKILISDGMFSLGENDKVNTLELAKEMIISKGDKPKISHRDIIGGSTTITHKNLAQKQTITHEVEKVALILLWLGPLGYSMLFDKKIKTHIRVLH